MAYEEARTAAELAAKSILRRKAGTFPKVHNPMADLKRHHAVPTWVSDKSLSRLLADASRGAYGFAEPVTRGEAQAALRIVSLVVAASEGDTS